MNTLQATNCTFLGCRIWLDTSDQPEGHDKVLHFFELYDKWTGDPDSPLTRETPSATVQGPQPQQPRSQEQPTGTC